ncbi:hypothetical protein BC826DRAFT_1022993 [Russula brevipes]|nr:hypothetical protein BC826DRAFT_1022993 [Russula brevipes]
MLRLRKPPPISFTASQFRVGEPDAITFSTNSPTVKANPNAPDHNNETISPSFWGISTATILTPMSTWLSRASHILCCLMISYFLSNIVHSVEQHLVCALPSPVTGIILQSGIRCDWHQTIFSHIIPFGHDFASLKTGAIVSPKLTTPGLASVPPSTALGDSAGTCWSFHGNAGTFGVVLDAPNLMPSHVVIRHWPSNLTASLSCAPRQITVWGLVDGEANRRIYFQTRHAFTSTLTRVPPFPMSKAGIFLPLAKIEFDITAQSLRQGFPVNTEVASWGIDFGVIVFHIHSNWGAELTSLCSVHIYGHTVAVHV